MAFNSHQHESRIFSQNVLCGAKFLFLLFILSSLLINNEAEKIYKNEFAISIKPGPDADQRAEQIAKLHGLENRGQIGSLEGHYLLVNHRLHKRSLEYSHDHHSILKSDPRVNWVEQQHELKRVKRSERSYPTFATDPFFPDQWYLNKGAKGGFDMNVAKVWSMGYTGKGIVVTILDDGIQPNHPDLANNYDPQASYDINDNDPDPTPQDNNDNKHGTRCAGEVAAIAFNEFCGVGIAFNASIGGVRMLDGTVTDEVEARALSLSPNHVDVYSASWGPEDDGKTVDGPGRLAKRAFVDGIKKGRHGKGSIYVWASGNGGRRQDNCNCDGYTNSVYTLSISSATQSGSKPWYLEECSSTLATTYSSGSPGRDLNIVTVDMDTSYFRSLKTEREPITRNLCTKSHTGTSASAPIAAAICALALEANPGLTWRDMQYIVVLTSRYIPVRFAGGWAINGVGRQVNHKFGYGVMDAEAMVKMAKDWRGLPKQNKCETPFESKRNVISANRGEKLVVSLTTNACQGSSNEVRYLEHVQAKITLKFKPRGNLKISLVSPMGTVSHLLFPRPRDLLESTFSNWPFLSVHYWGEKPSGTWQLVIVNDGVSQTESGELISWGLSFLGSYEKPVINGTSSSYSTRNLPRRTNKFEKTLVNHCGATHQFSMIEEPFSCVDHCPEGQYNDFDNSVCQLCNLKCQACYGGETSNCLSCASPYFYFDDSCIEQCPDGYYADEKLRECLPCSHKCLICSDRETCQVCKEGYIHSEEDNYRCLSKSKTIGSWPCHPTCASCLKDLPKICTSCSAKGALLLNNTCVSSCPVNYFKRSDECIGCHKSCHNCDGASHRNCTSCEKDKVLTKDGMCSSCKPDEFMSSNHTCLSCHSNCATCNGPSEQDCRHCRRPLILSGSRCVPCCDLYNPSSNALMMEGKCCLCQHDNGPCMSQYHSRSLDGLQMQSYRSSESRMVNLIREPFNVVVAICFSLAAVFALMFFTLQGSFVFSKNKDHSVGKYDYRRVPESDRQKLVEEDDEEDTLFQKT